MAEEKKHPQQFRIDKGWPLNVERGTRGKVEGTEFEREVAFRAGHANTPGDGPSSNYGIDALDIIFLLHGPKGSIQFVFSTGIIPEKENVHHPSFRSELFGGTMVAAFDSEEWSQSKVYASDIGRHALVPGYEGETPRDDCPFTPGGICYYDGSGLQAEPILEKFLTVGEDAMWAELEVYYRGWLEGEFDKEAVDTLPGGELIEKVIEVLDPRGDGSGDNLDGSLNANSSLDWDPRDLGDR